MYAIRPDGTELWNYVADGTIVGAAAIGADGSIYFGSNDGFLYAIGTPIPEPSTACLFVAAVGLFAIYRRPRSHSARCGGEFG